MVENLLQQFKTILNDVWDRANHRLMGTSWAGSGINSYMFETDATILNDVWDPINHSLNIVGSGGGGSGDALVANPLSQFAATTSLQLKGVISDETGSGALVFATLPTLITPVLGIAAGTSLALTPTAASAMAGINVTQSGPTSGSNGTSLEYNHLLISSEQANVGAGTNYVSGLKVSLITGGTNAQGSRAAIQGVTLLYTPSDPANPGRDHVGVYGVALADSGDGGTNLGAGARGTIFGMSSIALARSGATNLGSVSAAEMDVGILTGASSAKRLGLSMVGIGQLQASTLIYDIAFEVASAGQPWQYGLSFTTLHGGAPVTTTGTLIGTDGTSFTVANGLDFSSATISGNFLKGPASSFLVSGVGAVTGLSFNKLTLTTPATSATLTIANGKTLTASNTLTLTGTDSSSVAFGAGGTVAYQGSSLSVFGSTTSAQLASIISDETGSGSLVFNTSPSFVTSFNVGIGFAKTDTTPRTAFNILTNDGSPFGLFVSLTGGASLPVRKVTIESAELGTGLGGALLLQPGGGTAVMSTVLTTTFGGGVQVGAPTGGDKGVGTINAAGIYYANGTAGISAGSFATITAITATTGLITQLTGTSDERLKDILGPFTRGLTEVRQLQPIRWNWNNISGWHNDQTLVSFSAQNVQRVMPEAVGAETWADGRMWLTVNDRAILAATVNALKELDARLIAAGY